MAKKHHMKPRRTPDDKLSPIGDYLDFEVFPLIRPQVLFPQLNPEDQGHVFRMNCPECRKRTALWEKSSRYIKCPREVGCGFRGNILEMLAHPARPKGIVYKRLVKMLCDHVGKPDPAAPKQGRPVNLPPKFESVEQYLARGGKIRQ